MSPKNDKAVTRGLILAGGLSSRMGQKKSQLIRQQQTMLAFSIDLLKQVGCESILISGDRNKVGEHDFIRFIENNESNEKLDQVPEQERRNISEQIIDSQPVRCLPDKFKGKGPLSGIATAISYWQKTDVEHHQTDHDKSLNGYSLIVLPIDMPLLTLDLLLSLKKNAKLGQSSAFNGSQFPINIWVTSELESHLQELLVASDCHRALPITTRLNKTSKLSIRYLLSFLNAQLIHFEDSSLLLNTNTPDEWQNAKHYF